MIWIDYLFHDEETGEDFLVEVPQTSTAKEEAIKIAEENFEEPRLIRKMDEDEADILGYDTY